MAQVFKNPLQQAQALAKQPFKYWHVDQFGDYQKGLDYGGRKGEDAHDLLFDDVQKLLSKRGLESSANSMSDLVRNLKSVKDVHDWRKKNGGEYNPGEVWRDKLPANYDDQFPSRNLANIDDSYIGTLLRQWGYAFDDDPEITDGDDDLYHGEYIDEYY